MRILRKKENVLILGLLIFLAAFFTVLAGLKFVDYRKSVSEGTVFDHLVFYASGHGQRESVKCFGDVRVTPTEYYAFLPSFADNSAISVTFENRDHIVLTKSDGTEKQINSGDRLPEITIDEQYTISFCDKNGEVREKGNLIFKKSKDIAAAYITTASGSLDHVHAVKGNSEGGKLKIIESDGELNYSGRFDSLRGHGNSTWLQDKRPYQITLHKESSILGMSSAKKWIMLANALDASLMRNAVAYDMADSVMPGYSPELRYAEVYINGEYRGLYQFVEKAEIGRNRVNVTDLEAENDKINRTPPESAEKVTSTGENGSEQVGVKLEVQPEDITGGYLIEHDYGPKYAAEATKFTTKRGEKYVLRSPAYSSLDEVRYIADVFQDIEDRAYSGEDMSDLIDMKSFADKYVFEEFMKNEGAGVTSSYFYKDSDSIDSLVYAGPIWDYDQTMGNTFYPSLNDPETLDFCTNHTENTYIFYELWKNHEGFSKEAKRFYKDEIRPYVEKLLNGGLDEYFEVVENDDDMNSFRWGLECGAEEKDVETIRDFLTRRIAFLDKVWLSEGNLCTVQFEIPDQDKSQYVGVSAGETISIMPNFGKADDPTVWKDKETGEIVDEKTVINKDMVLTQK